MFCLGDSFTEGVGAPQDSTYPAILNNQLNKFTKDEINVINAGVGGSDIVFMFKLFEEKIIHLNPDCIILLLNSSDITDITIRGGNERFQPDCKLKYKNSSTLALFYNCFYTVRHICHDLLNLNHHLQSYQDQYESDEKAVDIIKNSLSDFKILCESNNIPLIVALNPMEFENKSNSILYLRISSFLKTNNFNFVDLFESFDNTSNRKTCFGQLMVIVILMVICSSQKKLNHISRK